VVTPLDTLHDQIDGGAVRGSNLFHSFQDFNIDDGRGTFFSNPAGIENILTRITGGNPSNIFGTLGVLGNANLFLINPNGIVFGPNARLDVGGSFFASTAEGITFLDGYQFSATNLDVPPLLTINVPIGLQFGANPEGIVNQSVATNDAGEVRGLEVPSGETLVLVGGNILFDEGLIDSPGSRVELAGLAAPGTVGLNPDGSLSVPSDVPRADVAIRNASIINVAGNNGGSIAIYARNLDILGSLLIAGIEGEMGSLDSQAGNMNIHTTGEISLKKGLITNNIVGGSLGNGGDINIQTRSLSVTDGAQLGVSTYGQGNAGSINLTATNTVSFDGQRNGFPSSAFSSVEPGALGHGGDINILTRNLFVTEGAQLVVSTHGQGNAGRVNITAIETVSFEGETNGISSAVFSSVSSGTLGDGGEINIQTGSLFVTDGAILTASNRGMGASGSLDLEAESIHLERATLSADTTAGNEGNINLRSQELVLRNNSRIRTDAFGTAIGGNITLNSDVIAALENSDISANAQEASGGRVTIDTRGLFGTAFRERLTPQSDITATSALGPDFSGTVEITPPEVDPASGLVSLPESPVDAASLFGKDFCSQRGTSQFIFTGRGGIPPSPFDPLGGSSPIEIDWVEAPDSLEVEEPESRQETPSPVVRPLIEAQGWVVAQDGTIVLTAQPHRGTPAPPALSHPDCQTFR
jgi:filamentous hemagglutinin family protein